MSPTENYGDEVFCQEMADEMYRLELVSKTYDFVSQRQIKSLNLKENCRCLDIGSGSGSMAAWLAKQPGISEVIALDRYVSLLKTRLQTSSRLKIIQLDINDDDNSLDQFDFINVRFVFMHLRQRAELLKKIAGWVKPGGWLVVSDIIDISPEQADDPLYHKVMSTMWNVLIETIGTDKNWSHSLNNRFKTLGFTDIQSEVYLPSVGKGSLMAEFWYLTWKQIHDRLIEMGDLDDETLTKAEKALIHGDVVALSPGMFTCIGRKPL